MEDPVGSGGVEECSLGPTHVTGCSATPPPPLEPLFPRLSLPYNSSIADSTHRLQVSVDVRSQVLQEQRVFPTSVVVRLFETQCIYKAKGDVLPRAMVILLSM